MDNYLAKKVVIQCEKWVNHQLKNKKERWFAGEESEIREVTLWKWSYILRSSLKKLEDPTWSPEFVPKWAIIWNFYKYSVSKWPVSRIKKRIRSLEKQE